MYSSPLLNRSAGISPSLNTLQSSDGISGLNNRFNGDGQDDAAAKTPSFLFGQKRRSMAPGTPSYMNNPYAGHSAPSNDIFASPIPNQLRGENASNSGKSVHWSPALVQERSHPHDASRPSLKSLPSQASGPFTPAGTLSPAPPLRSMRDEIEPVRKVSRRSVSLAGADSPFATAGGLKPAAEASQSAADTWVTVYGFPPEQASNVLKHFSRHGEIVTHQVPSRGNWMHIRYSCPVHARQALSRNASLIDSSLRIGVIPCTEKEIVGEDASQIASSVLNRSSVVEESIRDDGIQEIPSITPSKENQEMLDDSMNRSRLSMASRAGMRSLSVAYDSRLDQKTPQPVKHDSIMNKLWTAVGL
ncbi:MPPN domain protein [Ancylostoma caninum]|uniref:Nucleoporin NUP35 n=1 Tax=Ancylostoma caninum TaxID=29170 RepID=A0A368GUM5_ANCCA|nr:MPPN domain protein [Ancylostoma caninum]